MKVRDLLAACMPNDDASINEVLNLDVVVMHCGRESRPIDVKVMGHCSAVVQEGGYIEITDEMRANSTFSLCIMVEGWNERHD